MPAGRPAAEPKNLGKGWIGFNFEKTFGCPVKVINDVDIRRNSRRDQTFILLANAADSMIDRLKGNAGTLQAPDRFS